MGIGVSLIQLKERQQPGIHYCHPLDNLVSRVSRIINSHLLIREMDG